MRAATLDDVVNICELEYLLFPENNFNEVTIANELVLGHGLVEYDGDKLVGYLMLRDDVQPVDVMRLGVHPDYQKRGIGTRLLGAALQRCSYAMLTVRKDNATALKLYLRNGFHIMGELASGAGWVMCTQLLRA